MAALIEVAEVAFWLRFLRRYRVQTGAEGMLGERAEMIDGTRVRLAWRDLGGALARCAGAGRESACDGGRRAHAEVEPEVVRSDHGKGPR